MKNSGIPKEDLKDEEKIDIKDIKNKNTISVFSTKRKMKTKSRSSRITINKNIQILNIHQNPPKKNYRSKSIFIPNNKSSEKRNLNNKIRFSKMQLQRRKSTSEKNNLISSKAISFNKSEKFKEKPFETNNPTNKETKLDNFELNNLDFDEALKFDKRGFFSTYWSILKREHIIIFTFFIRNDYNLVYIKFARFMFLVCTDMAMNVFFFADETMHKMFLDYGKYNFLLQIPQIVISTAVSQFIEVFICFLSLTDKHFYEIKNLNKNEKDKLFSIMQCAKRKITFFFVFTFIMFAFYWYSIACFCAVYRNTQSAFIKDSISSFILGLLYPFILYLFPSVLRIISLKAGKARLSCIYKTSDIIPFF